MSAKVRRWNGAYLPGLICPGVRRIRQPLPVFLPPVPGKGFRTVGRNVEIQHRGLAVVVEEPRIDEKPIRGDREIMAELPFADACRGIVSVTVPTHLAAKAANDDPGASRAIAGLMLPAGKYPFIA